MNQTRPPLSAAHERLLLGDAAIVSVRQACRLLPWDDKLAATWMRERGLVRAVDRGDGTTKEVVFWGEVRAALADGATCKPPSRRSDRPRAVRLPMSD